MQTIERLIPETVSDWGWTEARRLHIRRHRRLTFSPASVLVFLWGNWVPEDSPRNVARYAVPEDYHIILGAELDAMTRALETLYPEDAFVWFCDASPVPEVEAAVLAGLGQRGLHNLLLHPKLGTRLHIGEILTTRVFPPSERVSPPLCDGCGKCVRACPAGALSGGFRKEQCLSFLTQQKGVLSAQTCGLIRQTGILWGCDVCADACPWNASPEQARHKGFYAHREPMVRRENLEALCASRAYGWRGAQVVLRNLEALDMVGD